VHRGASYYAAGKAVGKAFLSYLTTSDADALDYKHRLEVIALGLGHKLEEN
jgi:hypothetical protein